MSAAELGEQLGRNKEYVDRRENGQYDYSPGDLRLIAELTGAPLEFLLHGTGWTAGTWERTATRAGQEIARAARARNKTKRSPGHEAGASGSEPQGPPPA